VNNQLKRTEKDEAMTYLEAL